MYTYIKRERKRPAGESHTRVPTLPFIRSLFGTLCLLAIIPTLFYACTTLRLLLLLILFFFFSPSSYAMMIFFFLLFLSSLSFPRPSSFPENIFTDIISMLLHFWWEIEFLSVTTSQLSGTIYNHVKYFDWKKSWFRVFWKEENLYWFEKFEDKFDSINVEKEKIRLYLLLSDFVFFIYLLYFPRVETSLKYQQWFLKFLNSEIRNSPKWKAHLLQQLQRITIFQNK